MRIQLVIDVDLGHRGDVLSASINKLPISTYHNWQGLRIDIPDYVITGYIDNERSRSLA